VKRVAAWLASRGRLLKVVPGLPSHAQGRMCRSRGGPGRSVLHVQASLGSRCPFRASEPLGSLGLVRLRPVPRPGSQRRLSPRPGRLTYRPSPPPAQPDAQAGPECGPQG
jgi:hypothetical protein